LKYFAKHLGCRVASDDYTLPPNLATSLSGADLKPFEASFARNAGIADFDVRGMGVLHNFPLIGTVSPPDGAVHCPYISGMIVGYLDVVYRYDYHSRFSWEGDPIIPSSGTVRLGEYVRGAPHLSNGGIPGPNSARKVEIGGTEFNIPVLSIEHIRHIMALDLPRSDMTVEQKLDAKLKVAHAILSPFYPDVTLNFLEENLTITDSDALWKCVFPSSH